MSKTNRITWPMNCSCCGQIIDIEVTTKDNEVKEMYVSKHKDDGIR